MTIKARKLVLHNVDLLFRVAGLGGKFLLMLVLAKTMPASEMGAFGLVTSAISVCLYFVGLDFYVYSTREVLSNNTEKSVGDIIYNQFLFFVATYILLLIFWPFISSISNVTDFSTVAFLLIITEHLSQELYRILIALKKNKFANFCLFVKSGAWCYVLIPFLFYKHIELKYVFSTWFIFSLTTVLMSFIYLNKIGLLKISNKMPDMKWIMHGIKICAFFFLGTIAIRAMSYLDKVIAIHFIDLNILGVYVFYVGIANAIQSVVDVLIMTRYYPDVVKHVQNNNVSESKSSLRAFRSNNIRLNILLYILGASFCYGVALLTGKQIYLNYYVIFIMISISNIILNISMPYHYWIYAKKKDRFLICTNVYALVMFVVIAYGCFTFIPQIGIMAVLLAVIFSNLFILFRKKSYYHKVLS
jgi:O-antigen/teichoic acid export membrane protein